MSIQWLALVAALFLAPGAVALASIGVALVAGAVDVAARRRTAALRCAGIFAATSAMAVAWSSLALWLAARMPAPPLVVSPLAAVVAAAPPLRLLIETLCGGGAGRGLVLALASAAVINGAVVAALLFSALMP